MDAGGNIVNETLKERQETENGFTEVAGQTSAITAKGSLTVKAGGDFKNTGADIVAGSGEFEVDGDILFDALQLEEEAHSSKSYKKGSVFNRKKVTEETTNYSTELVQGTVQFGGDLSIASGGNTTIEATTIEAGGNLAVSTGGDLNVIAGEEVDGYTFSRKTDGNFSNATEYETKENSKIVKSGLVSGGTVSTYSDGNTTLFGADIKAKEADLSAKGTVALIAAADSERFSNEKGSKGFSQHGGYMTTSQVDHQDQKVEVEGQLTINSGGVTAISGVDVNAKNLKVAADGGFYAGTVKDQETESKGQYNSFLGMGKKEDASMQKTTNQVTDLDVSGMMAIESEKDITFEGTKIEVGEKASFKTPGNLNFLAVKDTQTHMQSSQKTGLSIEGLGLTNTKFQMTSQSSLSYDETVKGAQMNVKTIDTEVGGKLTMAASDMAVAGDANIKTTGGVDQLAVAETHYTETSQKKTELGFKGVKLEGYNLVAESSGTHEKNVEKSTATLAKTSGLQIGGKAEIQTEGSLYQEGGAITIGSGTVEAKEGIKGVDVHDVYTSESETTKETLALKAKLGNQFLDSGAAAYEKAKSIEKNIEGIDTSESNGAVNSAAKALQATLDTMELAAMTKEGARTAGSAATLGFYVDVDVEVSQEQSRSKTHTEIGKGSSITATNGDLSLKTEGAVDYTGSLSAGKDHSLNVSAESMALKSVTNKTSEEYESDQNSYTQNIFSSTGTTRQQEVNTAKSKTNIDTTTYVGGGINAGKVVLDISDKLTLDGTRIEGKRIETEQKIKEVDIISRQNELTLKSTNESLSFSASPQTKSSPGSKGGSFSVGENSVQETWTAQQAGIIASEGATLAFGDTTLVGGIIATERVNEETGAHEDVKNLTLSMDSVDSQDLKDSSKGSYYQIGAGANLGQGGNTQNQKSLLNNGKVHTEIGYSGYEKEQNTASTIGQGTTTIGGETLDTLVGTEKDPHLNTDITKAQELTKDKKTGGLDLSLSVDTKALTDTKAYIKEGVENVKGMVYTEEAGWGGSTKTFTGAPHYIRNELNDPEKADLENGGIKMSKTESALHGEGNEKFISPDGHHEMVRNEQDKTVLREENDPMNMGTYNWFNPKGNGLEKLGHGVADVGPYIIYGNTPDDPSTVYSRSKDVIKAGPAYIKQKLFGEKEK